MITVDYRSDLHRFADSESLYLKVRRAEGRLVSPEGITKLPWVPPSDPHAREWLIRATTADRLIDHFRTYANHPRILDIGCGPGWMTARLVRELDATAVGIDCNRSELERGAEAFSTVEGLELVYGDIFEPVVDAGAFDAVIVVSALQYFQDPQALVHRLLGLLKPQGEVLIADTPLYTQSEVEAAAQRTKEYYAELGFPEMADHYHHHAMDDLAEFAPEILYDPRSLMSRIARRWLRRPLSPFPILAIRTGGNP